MATEPKDLSFYLTRERTLGVLLSAKQRRIELGQRSMRSEERRRRAEKKKDARPKKKTKKPPPPTPPSPKMASAMNAYQSNPPRRSRRQEGKLPKSVAAKYDSVK